MEISLACDSEQVSNREKIKVVSQRRVAAVIVRSLGIITCNRPGLLSCINRRYPNFSGDPRRQPREAVVSALIPKVLRSSDLTSEVSGGALHHHRKSTACAVSLSANDSQAGRTLMDSSLHSNINRLAHFILLRTEYNAAASEI